MRIFFSIEYTLEVEKIFGEKKLITAACSRYLLNRRFYFADLKGCLFLFLFFCFYSFYFYFILLILLFNYNINILKRYREEKSVWNRSFPTHDEIYKFDE